MQYITIRKIGLYTIVKALFKFYSSMFYNTRATVGVLRPIIVVFVVDKSVLGQDFSQYFAFPRLFPLCSKRILHLSTTDGIKS